MAERINGFNEDLQDKLRKVTDERDTAIKEKKELVERIDSEFGKKIKDLEEKIAELQKQIETLQKQIEKLLLQQDSNAATLYVAQAASFFQQAICCAVLPGTFEGDSSAKIQQMVNYLKPNGEELPQGATDDLEENGQRFVVN